MESEHCRVNREKLTFCWALEPAAATGGAADHSAPCRGDTGDVTPVSGHPAPASRDPAETRERDSVLSSVLDQEPPGADVQTPLPPGQSLSESVVSRVIGEIVRYPSNNYQLQQLVQSSLMVSLIYHLMLPWLFAFFLEIFSDVTIIHSSVISYVKSFHSARASHPLESSRGLDAKNSKSLWLPLDIFYSRELLLLKVTRKEMQCQYSPKQ